ncbi:MAG: class I SAM-dependent methyltransferase [Hyphomicrobiaceae bacterium]
MLSLEAFVQEHTVLGAAPLVPEIVLHLARDADGIFGAGDTLPREIERFPPYWAFAWPGGQATARWLLDHREAVAGKRVVDIGAGSGIAAIAAAMAGAAHVLAADVDPVATAAIALNAGANAVTVATTTTDILGILPPADLVLIGDLVYDPELATRVAALLESAARQGVDVLFADRTSERRPPLAFDLLAEYAAPLTPPLAAHPFERARLWQLKRRLRKAGR